MYAKLLPVTLDVTRLAARLLEGKHPTGVDRVSLAYVEHYRPRALALVRHWGRWMELGRPASQRLFAALLGEAAAPRRDIRASVAGAYALNWRWQPGGWFFNTGHSGLDHPNYARAVLRRGLRPVYFLHDLIPLTHPEYCRVGEANRHHQRLGTMLRTGRALIVNSQHTLDAVTRYAAAQGLPMPPHRVAPLAAAPLPAGNARAPIDRPYFVMIGTIEPRKNHLLLLHAWRRLTEAGGTTLPALVILGQRGWECEQVIDLLERCPPLKGCVIEVPRATDAELATWLRHARALLFPSFAEGFGMPLIESLTLGVPVIASDLPSFHEMAGDVPDYLDPLDGPAWLRAVLDYARPDSTARAAQLERLQEWRVHTWAAHFAGVDQFLAALPP